MGDLHRQRLHAGATLVCVLALIPVVAVAEVETGFTATTVYRSVDVDGVVTFSDSPHPAATAVEVFPPPPADARELRNAAQLFEQQLALIEILEASRAARAADELAQQRLRLDYVRTEAALERSRALAEQRDNTYYPVFGYPYVYGRGNGPRPAPPIAGRPPHRPPHVDRPREQPKQYVQLP